MRASYSERETLQNSHNFRIETEDGSLFNLKKSNNKDHKRQEMVNSGLMQVRELGIPAPRLLLTKSDNSYSQTKTGEIYCLYNFIGNRHYNGSRKDMLSVANAVSSL